MSKSRSPAAKARRRARQKQKREAGRARLKAHKAMAGRRLSRPSEPQKAVLQQFGYRTDIPRMVARQIIERIAQNDWNLPDPPPVPDLLEVAATA